VTDDGRYLIISVWRGTERKNLIYYKDLKRKNAEVVELIPNFEAQYDFVDNNENKFLFRSDFGAPRFRLIEIDIENPIRANWNERIPQVTATLDGVSSVGGRLFASYLKDAYTQVAVFSDEGRLERMVELPGLGTAGGFYGTRKDKETFYSYESFTQPDTIYRYDIESGQASIFRRPSISVDPDKCETKQVRYKSKDGTEIPMFITYKKGIKLDGQNPTLLYGYGGFNISITPNFSVTMTVWLEMGGVLAVANLRGGGEYGSEWHEAGMKLKKQNCFDDFIAAAEWLIANKYTSSQKLAINGRSNGGLLVGAAITQRPELFGAALPGVGVLDMLRFPKWTIGWAWVSDYGSPENEAEFKALHAYSPYHNLKAGTSYPATLITTADHDDRVVPYHSFKFAARLQEVQSGPEPVLIRIETKAGHGAGKPTTKKIEEAADELSFLVKELGVKVDGMAGTPTASKTAGTSD
jgi:prolyl oligopeptidase